LDQPPLRSGNVTSPARLRQKSPSRQYGGPAVNPSLAAVSLPAAVTQPALPKLSMWTSLPFGSAPSPSIETPVAEYSQSIG
jgi:hypothetical protein